MNSEDARIRERLAELTSGEACGVHGSDPCDCDTAERHALPGEQRRGFIRTVVPRRASPSCPWCKDWAEGQCDHYGGF